MWEIVIVCKALVCERPPAIEPNAFPNKAFCEMVLTHLAQSWKPKQGAYTFNCLPAEKA